MPISHFSSDKLVLYKVTKTKPPGILVGVWHVGDFFIFLKLKTDLTKIRLSNFLQIKKFKVLKLFKDVFETGLKAERNWYDDDE